MPRGNYRHPLLWALRDARRLYRDLGQIVDRSANPQKFKSHPSKQNKFLKLDNDFKGLKAVDVSSGKIYHLTGFVLFNRKKVVVEIEAKNGNGRNVLLRPNQIRLIL